VIGIRKTQAESGEGITAESGEWRVESGHKQSRKWREERGKGTQAKQKVESGQKLRRNG
jgi:hypothetical protein